MQKAFRFRIYPSKKQESNLNNQLELSKRLFNHLLEKSNEKYKSERKLLTKFDMNKHLTEFKKEHPEYKDIHSQVLQNICDRLSKAFSNFFRRVKRKRSGQYFVLCGQSKQGRGSRNYMRWITSQLNIARSPRFQPREEVTSI